MLRKKKKVNMKTLKTIFQENNHTNSPVEYLKVCNNLDLSQIQ